MDVIAQRSADTTAALRFDRPAHTCTYLHRGCRHLPLVTQQPPSQPGATKGPLTGQKLSCRHEMGSGVLVSFFSLSH
jgi:hypothetical protein